MKLSCFECGEPARHAHHVVPRSRGGTRTIPLCAACHRKAHMADTTTLQREAIERAALLDDHDYRKECVWNFISKNPRATTRDLRDAGLYDGILPNMMYEELRHMTIGGFLIAERKGKGHEHRYTIGREFSRHIADKQRKADAAAMTLAISRATA